MNDDVKRYDDWTEQTFKAAHGYDHQRVAKVTYTGITRGQWGIGRTSVPDNNYSLTHLPTGASISRKYAPDATVDQLKELADRPDGVVPDTDDFDEVTKMRDWYETIVEEWAEEVQS